jgi:hypothetical protein
MYVTLWLIGLVASAAGLATLGFGISNIEFSLGNTLVLAGTMGLSTGLILIGLAVALRQLERMAEALARPMPRVPRAPEQEMPAGPARPAAARAPFPPKPNRDEAAPEPRFVPLSEQEGTQRANHRAGGPAEEEAEAPLSPQVPRGAAARERRSRGDPPWRPILPNEQPDERSAKKGMFDNLWPAGPRPVARKEPPLKSETPPAFAPTPEPTENQPSGGEKHRGVAILKSGVVDGMAYTLYADGSIEAELPEGTVRFASIDELRVHLEKHS